MSGEQQAQEGILHLKMNEIDVHPFTHSHICFPNFFKYLVLWHWQLAHVWLIAAESFTHTPSSIFFPLPMRIPSFDTYNIWQYIHICTVYLVIFSLKNKQHCYDVNI